MKISRNYRNRLLVIGHWSLAIACLASPAFAQKIRLKDGRVLTGKVLRISGIADNTFESPNQNGETKALPIQLVDDDLRRVFVPWYSVASVVDSAAESSVKPGNS